MWRRCILVTNRVTTRRQLSPCVAALGHWSLLPCAVAPYLPCDDAEVVTVSMSLFESRRGREGAPYRAQSEESQRRYWEGFLRLGFVVFLLESAAAVGYAACSRVVPHRGALVAVALGGVIVSILALCWVRWLSATPNRTSIVATIDVGSSVLLTVAVMLDGGLDSPLLYLLVLPMMAAALALPPLAATVVGCVASAEVALVSLADPHVLGSSARLVLLIALLLGVLLLSVGASMTRDRLQREESVLVERLTEMASTDSLTGCCNHRTFYERLNEELARAERSGQPLALVIADVDLFKSFNDRRGHRSGDEQLAAVGAELRRRARRGDIAARIGGDEFALILPNTDAAAAEAVSTRIAAALHAAPTVAVTLSYGVSELDPGEPTASRLFRDADAALYQAKSMGRDRVQGAQRHAPSAAGAAGAAVPEDRDLLRDELLALQHEMAESKAVAQALQDAAPTALGFMDRDLRLLEVNPALARIAGMPIAELRGRRLDDAFPEEWVLLAPLLRRVMDQQCSEDFVAVEPPRTPDDLERTWHAYVFPVLDEGRVIGAGTVMVDVSDALRAAEAQRGTTERVVAALAAASEMRDPYTSGHQNRVGEIATEVARELGLDEAHVDDIGLAASIHDVGKVGVPSEILTKPGRLSEEELALVRTHAALGGRLLEQVEFPERVSEIVRHHHERLDGSGYPDGLRGEELSIGVRIVAVADVAEAVASRRPYRAAQGVHAAMEVLAEQAGHKLDPLVVAALVRLLNEGRIVLGEDHLEGSVRPAATSPRRARAEGALVLGPHGGVASPPLGPQHVDTIEA